jgi:hypothetical protein
MNQWQWSKVTREAAGELISDKQQGQMYKVGLIMIEPPLCARPVPRAEYTAPADLDVRR